MNQCLDVFSKMLYKLLTNNVYCCPTRKMVYSRRYLLRHYKNRRILWAVIFYKLVHVSTVGKLLILAELYDLHDVSEIYARNTVTDSNLRTV